MRSLFVQCGRVLRAGSSRFHAFNDLVNYFRAQREGSNRDSGDDSCCEDRVEEEVRVEAQDPSCQVRAIGQGTEHGNWGVETGHEDEWVEDGAKPDNQS